MNSLSMLNGKEPNKCVSRRDVLKYGLFGGLASVLTPIFLLNGCSHNPFKRKKPNILMISMDTVRRDHCSSYGYQQSTTPNLDAFCKQGTIFDQAYAPTSTTGPSHATMFTSLYPIAHHVKKNGLKLSENHITIAEILKSQGYQTSAIIGSFVLSARFGYSQGFSFFDESFELQGSKHRVKSWEGNKIDGAFCRRGNYVTNNAISWLKNKCDPDEPFFLFAHYFDPHNPYDPHEPFLSKFYPSKKNPNELEETIGKYDGEIAFIDYEIGKLLNVIKQMGLEEETLVIITSDHGEGLMEHNRMYHGVNIYEEAVRVPLLMRWPNVIKRGRIINNPVSLIDLTPTILDLIGINPDNWPFQGKSLVLRLQGESGSYENPIYLYRRHYKKGIVGKTYVNGEQYGVRIGSWKYIEGKDEKLKLLFNIATDPQESKNLCTSHLKRAKDLESHLKYWKKEHVQANNVLNKIPEKELERLKALGYVE